jgi:hypothetical protein
VGGGLKPSETTAKKHRLLKIYSLLRHRLKSVLLERDFRRKVGNISVSQC